MNAYRKIRLKHRLLPYLGLLYVGRRMKWHYLRKLLRDNVPARSVGSILEVGSGDGTFVVLLSRLYPRAQVAGCDINSTEIAACRQILGKHPRLRFSVDDALTLQSDGFKYDLIVCLDVLEHIGDDVAALKRMHDSIVPGGKLLLHVPANAYRELNGEYRFAFGDAVHMVHGEHARQGYAPQELAEKLASAGFQVVHLRPCHGYASVLAQHIDAAFSRRSFLRFLRIVALPVYDLLTLIDMQLPSAHGNTVAAVAFVSDEPSGA